MSVEVEFVWLRDGRHGARGSLHIASDAIYGVWRHNSLCGALQDTAERARSLARTTIPSDTPPGLRPCRACRAKALDMRLPPVVLRRFEESALDAAKVDLARRRRKLAGLPSRLQTKLWEAFERERQWFEKERNRLESEIIRAAKEVAAAEARRDPGR